MIKEYKLSRELISLLIFKAPSMFQQTMNYSEEGIRGYISSLKTLYDKIDRLNEGFPEIFENVLKEYFKPIKIICKIGSGVFPTLERITVNKRVIKTNERILNSKDLKYPPEKCVKNFGRANLKGQSVFYGTFNFITAIKEMQPEVGDLITISSWGLIQKENYLVTCPMFLSQPQNSHSFFKLRTFYTSFFSDLLNYPKPIANLIYELHRFYAKCFSREISRSNSQAYIFTALLADKILNHHRNGVIDAILYPSTKDDLLTDNIAIKKESFDKNYVLLNTIEKRLTEKSENSEHYEFEITGKSKEVKGEEIVWND